MVLWDISTATFDSSKALVGSTEPGGIFLRDNGKDLFVCTDIPDAITHYILSTPYEISSAISVFSYAISLEPIPTGISFNSEGTRMFIYGASDKKFFQYNLSNAWSLSSVLKVGELTSTTEDTAGADIYFQGSGSRAYLLGDTGNRVYEYSMTTPSSLATMSFTGSSFGVSFETSPTGIFFAPSGGLMYIVGSLTDRVFKYKLSTPWNLATATFSGSSFTVFTETVTESIIFDASGSKFYTVGSSGDRIYQYSMPNVEPPPASGTNTFINIGDNFKNVSVEHINIGDAWKNVSKKFINIGDAWKNI